MKILFSATIHDFELMPYYRMTQCSQWADPRARKYKKQQRDLAILFQEQARSFPTLACLCRISIIVNRIRKVGDLSNYLKAIEDALQYGRIIENDRQIRGIGPSALIHENENSVFVKLEEI